jgi:hypothetical protein
MLKGSDLFTILGAEDDVLGKALGCSIADIKGRRMWDCRESFFGHVFGLMHHLPEDSLCLKINLRGSLNNSIQIQMVGNVG